MGRAASGTGHTRRMAFKPVGSESMNHSHSMNGSVIQAEFNNAFQPRKTSRDLSNTDMVSEMCIARPKRQSTTMPGDGWCDCGPSLAWESVSSSPKHHNSQYFLSTVSSPKTAGQHWEAGRPDTNGKVLRFIVSSFDLEHLDDGVASSCSSVGRRIGDSSDDTRSGGFSSISSLSSIESRVSDEPPVYRRGKKQSIG